MRNGLRFWSWRVRELAASWPWAAEIQFEDPPDGFHSDAGWWLSAKGDVTQFVDQNRGGRRPPLVWTPAKARGAFGNDPANVLMVTLPRNFEGVEKFAFGPPESGLENARRFGNLVRVSIPATVTSIGDRAFKFAGRLEKVELPVGLTSLGHSAFVGCWSLKSVGTFPPGLTVIPDHTFDGCSSLTRFIIPDTVTRIGASAFSGAGVTELVVPISVAKIGYHAFNECRHLARLEIPATAELEWGVFAKTAIATLELPPTMKVIGQNMFADSKLQRIAIPDGVTVISPSAFMGCSELREITIPPSVWAIRSHAFRQSGLVEFTIPETVTEMNVGVFLRCPALRRVVFLNNPTIIEHTTFKGCSSLVEVVLPPTATIIRHDAFAGCTSLASVVIPESVAVIQKGAFKGCSALRELTIPSNVKAIENDSFEGVELTRLVLTKTSSRSQIAVALVRGLIGCLMPDASVVGPATLAGRSFGNFTVGLC
jgi:hypothetical protein